MSITAESKAQPKISARARIANWLNKTFLLSVAEDDPDLINKARAFGGKRRRSDDDDSR